MNLNKIWNPASKESLMLYKIFIPIGAKLILLNVLSKASIYVKAPTKEAVSPIFPLPNLVMEL
jgi:hypothetical protein